MHTGDDGSGRRRTAIIVSGMHHSGTSAITRVVSLLGADLPSRLVESHDDNERGYRDGRAVVDLDRRILDRFGSWWSGWDRIGPQQQRNLTRMVEGARRLIRDDFPDSSLVVVKDPQISRLLPLWTLAFEKEQFRCVHILALRHPAAVASALGRREQLSPKATTLSWLAHSLDAEYDTRAQPRVVVSFEKFLRRWRPEVDRISRALAVEWPQALDDVADSIADLIEPDLAHEPPASALKGQVAAVTPVYDVLRRWSEDDNRPGDVRTLDSWRASLEPVRRERSAVARMSLDRREVIEDLRVRRLRPGRLGSAEVWNPIQAQGHNLEAAAAWSWLLRERQGGASDRAAREALRTQRDEREGHRGVLPRVVRRVRLLRALDNPVVATTRSRLQGTRRRVGQ